ncbi:hypothetical protein V2O64_15030 [Verrucomicrobiaceae bacterium 227]
MKASDMNQSRYDIFYIDKVPGFLTVTENGDVPVGERLAHKYWNRCCLGAP